MAKKKWKVTDDDGTTDPMKSFTSGPAAYLWLRSGQPDGQYRIYVDEGLGSGWELYERIAITDGVIRET